jgi:hypothetical protein
MVRSPPPKKRMCANSVAPREDDFSWSQFSGKPIRLSGRFIRFFDGFLVYHVERVTYQPDMMMTAVIPRTTTVPRRGTLGFIGVRVALRAPGVRPYGYCTGEARGAGTRVCTSLSGRQIVLSLLW